MIHYPPQPDYIEIVETEFRGKPKGHRVQFRELPMKSDGTWISGWSTPHYLYPTDRGQVQADTEQRWPGVEIRWGKRK